MVPGTSALKFAPAHLTGDHKGSWMPSAGEGECIDTGRVMDGARPHFWNGAQRSNSVNTPSFPRLWLLPITLIASPSLCGILEWGNQGFGLLLVGACGRWEQMQFEAQTQHMLAPRPGKFLSSVLCPAEVSHPVHTVFSSFIQQAMEKGLTMLGILSILKFWGPLPKLKSHSRCWQPRSGSGPGKRSKTGKRIPTASSSPPAPHIKSDFQQST